MRVELGQIEHVADEAAEPLGLAATISSDASTSSGSVTTPSRSAATCPRIAVSGVRSSCETDIRKLRSSSSASASRAVICRKRSVRWPISPPPGTCGTSTS